MLETMLSSFENNFEGTNIAPLTVVSDKILVTNHPEIIPFSEVYSPSTTHAINRH